MVVPSHSFFDTIFLIYLSMQHYNVNKLNVTSWINMDHLLYHKEFSLCYGVFGRVKLTHYTVGNEGTVQKEVQDMDMLRPGSDGLFPVTLSLIQFLLFLFTSKKNIYLSMQHYNVNKLSVMSWVNMDNLLYHKEFSLCYGVCWRVKLTHYTVGNERSVQEEVQDMEGNVQEEMQYAEGSVQDKELVAPDN